MLQRAFAITGAVAESVSVRGVNRIGEPTIDQAIEELPERDRPESQRDEVQYVIREALDER